MWGTVRRTVRISEEGKVGEPDREWERKRTLPLTKQSMQNSYKVVGHFVLNAQRHDDPHGTLCTFAYLCLCFHFGFSLFIHFSFISLAIF